MEKTELSPEFANQKIKPESRAIIDREKTKNFGYDLPDETGEKFAGLEKDLFAIGFFSAPKYRDGKKKPKQEKIVKLTSSAETEMETRAEILTHARYGLPTTGDLTKYLAFLQIVRERCISGGGVENPIQFTHYELLQKAHLTRSQAAQDEVTEWLERLDNTQIIIHGGAADNGAEEKRLYKLFSEVRLSGRTNKDGEKVKFNRVWLSDWAIKNICEKPLFPVDFETYQKLKNDVAKLLVVHLQVWLYASRRQTYFEKSYPKFCQLLDLKEKKSRSEIIRQLSPALNELKKYEYISGWELVPGSTGLKIKIWHGAKFQRDLKKGLGLTGEPENLKLEPHSDIEVEIDSDPFDEEKAQMLKRLTDLGIYKDLAKGLIGKLSLEKLELRIAFALKELHLKEQKEEVKKPGGLLYRIISSEDEPDMIDSETYNQPDFEISQKPFELISCDDQFLVDKEFEKDKWLLTQFERFCLTEAHKKPQPDLGMFAKSFCTGQEVFNEFIGEMRKQLNEQVFQSWFDPLRFAGQSGNLLYIAGSEINRDWVMTYYEPTVKEVFQKINRSDFQLEWIISDSIPPEAGIEYYYTQYLIRNYQNQSKIRLEEFYESNKLGFDRKFEAYFESSFGKALDRFHFASDNVEI